MEITSKFEIGIANGKAASYYHYKYICRLYIPIDRKQIAVAWLCEREAKILSATIENPYFIIIFTTNNRRLVKSINDKYKASKVDARVLYEKVKVHEECFESNEQIFHSSNDGDEDLQDEYYQETYREVFDYMEEYSNSMVSSSESGWFYSDPDHFSYERYLLDNEDSWS